MSFFLDYLWHELNKFNPIVRHLRNSLAECRATSLNRISALKSEYASLQRIHGEAKEMLNEHILPSDLDTFGMEHYEMVKPIAYEQKRDIKGKSYSIALNELITPEAYEVHMFFKGLDLDVDVKSMAKKVGDKISKNLIWRADKDFANSDDYYRMPSETITAVYGDCEDLTAVASSAHKEIGMCWGFFKTTGHAFGCFIHESSLYILDFDTINKRAIIKEYNNQDDYAIHFVITRKNYYKVKSGIQFGELAKW